MRGALLGIVLALGSLGAPSARAQPDPEEPVPAQTGPAPNREGDYGGVQPGQPGPKPAKPKRPPAKGTLSWIGFEAKDGGAQVFFQSPAAFEIRQRVEGGRVIAFLSLTRLGRNTWRKIDTRFFDNPLAGIVARATGKVKATKKRPGHGRGINVVFTFKNPRDAREATVRTATEGDGMYYAYLTFPEGADAKQPAAPDAEP